MISLKIGDIDSTRMVIRVLLGHKKLDTTALYSQAATRTIREVTSPLEHLVMMPPA